MCVTQYEDGILIENRAGGRDQQHFMCHFQDEIFLCASAKYNKAKGDEQEDDELAYYDIFAGDYRSSVVECDEIFRLLFSFCQIKGEGLC